MTATQTTVKILIVKLPNGKAGYQVGGGMIFAQLAPARRVQAALQAKLDRLNPAPTPEPEPTPAPAKRAARTETRGERLRRMELRSWGQVRARGRLATEATRECEHLDRVTHYPQHDPNYRQAFEALDAHNARYQVIKGRAQRISEELAAYRKARLEGMPIVMA